MQIDNIYYADFVSEQSFDLPHGCFFVRGQNNFSKPRIK